MAERLDPEMLKSLDLLLSMDVLENEADWELAEDLETVEHAGPDGQNSDEERKDE